MPRVGVFGGSFNPVHLGHLLLADEILELLQLDPILFVPASEPPHKPARGLAPAQDRYAMTELAIRGNPHFAISDLELRRPGPSYTVDTLQALKGAGGRDLELHLILGSETFLDLLSWRDPQRLARLARLVVIPRAGSAFDPEGIQAQKVLKEIEQERWIRVPPLRPPAEIGKGVFLVAATSLPISSSELRRRAREGRSLAYRVPEPVRAYILERRLYREESAGGS
ncbi:MAG: nicotinate (nicotinamide) nucleotide adenylyltransferase [Candidatus Rokubacteria bacterium]|nr:nicotinate (nicotinamide) nucleotide adenylyltransferase [Candidatus Rokubacteria bacterium]